MIILDLEWNHGYDKKPIDEILQIGAVRVERPGGPIIDTFNAFIRPVIHKKFDKGAKKLPELDCSMDSDLTFAQALEGFRAWCGEDREFGGWGCDDFKSLEQNCTYYGLPPIEVEAMRDLQRAYCHAVGAGNVQIALWRAVQYCDIPDVFCYHNALNDAMYTAILCKWLTEEDLNYVPPKSESKRRLVRFSEIPFDPAPRRKVGALPTPEAVLNSKNSRLLACPICGEQAWVTEWYTSDDVRYFSTFCCREHGRFLCRLTLTQVKGSWQGRLAVPELTAEHLAEFERARGGRLCHCKSLSRRRKRRRRRVAEKAADAT